MTLPGTTLWRERDERVVVDLFAGLGGFSQAFEDSDEWRVVTVDIEAEFIPLIRGDIGLMWPSDLGVRPDIVLASPPYTMFSLAGNHDHWDRENHVPLTPEARDAVALVPYELSREIRDGCEQGLDWGPVTQQSIIGDVTASNWGESV